MGVGHAADRDVAAAHDELARVHVNRGRWNGSEKERMLCAGGSVAEGDEDVEMEGDDDEPETDDVEQAAGYVLLAGSLDH